jgi:DNA topoisomerase 2-associated protein PAT1
MNYSLSLPHLLPYFLSISKGKKIIPRVMNHFTPDQVFAFVTALLARAESLDVCNMPAGTAMEAVDEFMVNVIPSCVSFISEVPLHVVNTCIRIILERHNMVWLAKSKVGLAFLTMLLSRAEILKQGGGVAQGLPPPSTEELNLW